MYRYWGDHVSLEQVIVETEFLDTGGTLAVQLGCHALGRGYQARIYTYNLSIFDPSWFDDDGPVVDLADKLRAQAKVKRDDRLRYATRCYLQFLELGGRLEFRELDAGLIRRHLKRGVPVLTGLSATYLYDCSRERGEHVMVYDDVAGYPSGHFVVLAGYDAEAREVLVADPLGDNPRFADHYYRVGMQRLLGAILLGVITYDANLLVIEPPRARRTP